MNRKVDFQDIELIQYPILSKFDEILQFTSTRMGGVSSGNYGSFNLSFFSDDEIKNVSTNRELLRSKLNIPKDRLIIPYQIHSNLVCLIDNNFFLLEKQKQQAKLNGVDGIITDMPNVCIAVSTADCVPILMYDPVNKAVAAVHAGWRGTCSRIASHTVRLMKSAYSTNPKDLVVAVGPSISPDVYEVGAELVDAFEDSKFDVNKLFFQKKGKIFLNLWKANKGILIENGIEEANIEVSEKCTYTESDKYFSARRLGIQSGRMLTGIMLR